MSDQVLVIDLKDKRPTVGTALKDLFKKTLTQLEADNSITESSCDISKRYLGLPPSKRFYKRGETDFQGMRRDFNLAVKRIGINVD